MTAMESSEVEGTEEPSNTVLTFCVVKYATLVKVALECEAAIYLLHKIYSWLSNLWP